MFKKFENIKYYIILNVLLLASFRILTWTLRMVDEWKLQEKSLSVMTTNW